MAKTVFDRIFKTIQIVLNFLMGLVGMVIAVQGVSTDMYVRSDWYAYAIYWVLGIVVFNGLFEYIRYMIKKY